MYVITRYQLFAFINYYRQLFLDRSLAALNFEPNFSFGKSDHQTKMKIPCYLKNRVL